MYISEKRYTDMKPGQSQKHNAWWREQNRGVRDKKKPANALIKTQIKIERIIC